MNTRSRRETITFQHPFRIKGIDRVPPRGSYEIITDEAAACLEFIRRGSGSGRH
jgi:hypothetical protein